MLVGALGNIILMKILSWQNDCWWIQKLHD